MVVKVSLKDGMLKEGQISELEEYAARLFGDKWLDASQTFRLMTDEVETNISKNRYKHNFKSYLIFII